MVQLDEVEDVVKAQTGKTLLLAGMLIGAGDSP
jgi:hypothetical protein